VGVAVSVCRGECRMAKRDYYEILGVERNANDNDLKIAYRKLAMKFHPDRNSGDATPTSLQEINEAYEVSKDGDKRARTTVSVTRRSTAGAGPASGRVRVVFRDIFDDFFGMGGGRRGRGSARARRRSALQYELTLEEAFSGKPLRSACPVRHCETCAGSGARPAPNRRFVQCAAARQDSACQGFSRWSGPVRAVTAADR